MTDFNRRNLALSIALAMAALQTGCATLTTADCDPAIEKDVITKTRCLSGGVYEQRISDIEMSYEEQLAIKKDLEATLAAVQQESAQVRERLRSGQQEYKQLNAAVNALLNRLKTKSAQNAALQKSIAEIEAKLAEVTTPQPDAGTLQKQAQLDELRQQLADLQKEMGL